MTEVAGRGYGQPNFADLNYTFTQNYIKKPRTSQYITSMPNQQIVQSKGIFHGLPVYPSSVKGLTAIITGANGISGNYMLRVLSEAPERWTKIYCLSRRPPAIPNGLPAHAEHIALDFLEEPEKIANVLKEKGVTADYVFFYSYVQAKPKEGGGLWSDAEEMCRVNSEPSCPILLAPVCAA